MYRVMIVDDEGWVVESLKKGIPWQEYGFEITGWASDGKEALDRIEEADPDVIFTDIRMPIMGGLDLIKQIHQQSDRIEFVVVSGYAEFAYAQKALNYGVTAYCLKPIDDDEVASVLKRLKKTLDGKGDEGSNLEDHSDIGKHPHDYETINSIRQNMLSYLQVGEESVVDDECHPLVGEVIQHIENNVFRDISLQDLSERFYISQNYLCRIFKKATGKSLTGYITELRMNYACEILKNTNIPIHEVSRKVGYDNYFYFARLFKRTLDMTPSQFREENL